MVRACAVDHPGEWAGSGYREIQRPLQRYRFIDSERTADLLGLWDAGDLLLPDNGFYSFQLMKMIIERGCSLIIPVSKNTRPQVVRKLHEHEWLVEISDSRRDNDGTLLMRLIYVYRDGFRRRRILTSLIDAETYISSDIAWLYHLRWDIETFYRDVKNALRACKWHCQSSDTFSDGNTYTLC